MIRLCFHCHWGKKQDTNQIDCFCYLNFYWERLKLINWLTLLLLLLWKFRAGTAGDHNITFAIVACWVWRRDIFCYDWSRCYRHLLNNIIVHGRKDWKLINWSTFFGNESLERLQDCKVAFFVLLVVKIEEEMFCHNWSSKNSQPLINIPGIF